ncbi:MAG: ISAzo13 family transposase [Desulfobacterales bacterium]|nr:ISAzo13 family transposase [Desulfobacterales bacterium]
MHGAERRSFTAEMTLKYCGGNARKAETVFGWNRNMTETGLGEKRTGIICVGAQSADSGRILWEEREPEAAEALRKLAEEHSQQDPTFRSTIAYTRLTAKAAVTALKEKGFVEEQLPSLSSMADILNRTGYRLRKVLKAKPLKKIKETDAIFDNIKEKDQESKNSPNVRRLSMDCKATVKIGDFSRGGQTRGDNEAGDHDFGCEEKYIPFGIVDEDSGELCISFGSSYKTSDFIVDTLESWWNDTDIQEQRSTALIQIKADNGSESSGVRTQFLNRMVNFSNKIGKPVHLLYYPPYHSKYNPIERCWGILENHWNGTKLINAETMLGWAGSMTWKGLNPVIKVSKNIYEKGISLTKSAMRSVEKFLVRNPLLPKWDILVNPKTGV